MQSLNPGEDHPSQEHLELELKSLIRSQPILLDIYLMTSMGLGHSHIKINIAKAPLT